MRDERGGGEVRLQAKGCETKADNREWGERIHDETKRVHDNGGGARNMYIRRVQKGEPVSGRHTNNRRFGTAHNCFAISRTDARDREAYKQGLRKRGVEYVDTIYWLG